MNTVNMNNDAPDTAAVRAAMLAGDADTLARHTIDSMIKGYRMYAVEAVHELPVNQHEGVAWYWADIDGCIDPVDMYCDTSVYGRDGETLAPLSDDVIDAITARVDAWLAVARQPAD